ncbi:MAG: hypothetical protein RH917_11320 [Lacipirellulaceae bacterium]
MSRTCMFRTKSLQFESLESRRLLALTSLGDELRVNDRVQGLQTAPADADAVAAFTAGGFVAAYSGVSFTDRAGVSVRRFDSEGAEIGSRIQVNTSIQGLQHEAAVATLDDGTFVVAWSGRGHGDKRGVFAQWFDSDGEKIGTEVLVNQTTGGVQSAPQLASLGNSVAIVWQGVGARSGEEDVDGVFLRTFDDQGNPTTDEQRVNSTTEDQQVDPSLAANSDGTLLVAWSSRHQDGSDWGVFAQRFAMDATSEGGELPVNTTTLGSQQKPSITALTNGEFQVAYQSRNAEVTNETILSQGFTSAGATSGVEVQLDDGAESLRRDVALAAIPSGGFVAGWASGVPNDDGWEVKLRDFDADGTALADEVFSHPTLFGPNSGTQASPSLAANAGGQLLAAWVGQGTTDRRGVFAQRFMTDGEIDNGEQQPPDLAEIPNQTIAAGETLMLTLTATDPNPLDLLFIQVDEDVSPPNVMINQTDFTATGTTATLTWESSESDAGSTFTFRILVTDDGVPTLADVEEFTVTIGEASDEG